MTPAEALLHLRYSGWASRKLMDAARALPSADLSKPLGVSHGTIAQTLGHIYLADRIWCSRVVDPALVIVREVSWEQLQADWPAIQQKWEGWAGQIDDTGLAGKVTYQSRIDGREHENQAQQIVMHVVNHATLHRGQVVGMLRQLGVKPPPTDLLFYYWELK
jgi:uncharacterized damage-inducible protein DinB